MLLVVYDIWLPQGSRQISSSSRRPGTWLAISEVLTVLLQAQVQPRPRPVAQGHCLLLSSGTQCTHSAAGHTGRLFPP